MKENKLLVFLVFIIIVLIISGFYYPNMIARFPYGIHAWAQSDRLSLAFGFYDYGMDLFMPRTFSITTDDSVTGVEFPIQAYLAALVGKLIGRNHINISYRILDTLISFAGFWYLFLSVYKRTKDFILSLLPPIFIFCSPVFIYYTCSYMPDTASASLVFISFYFLLNYIEDQRNRNAVIALLYLILATLIKTSSVIYLLSAMLFIFSHKFFYEEKIRVRSYWLITLVSLVGFYILYRYFQYNNYLNGKYNSGVFLAAANPFPNTDALIYYLTRQLKEFWISEYFVIPQYYLFPIVVIAGIFFLRRQAGAKKQLLLSAMFLVTSVIMGYLLGMQLMAHDYYVIAIFMPCLMFLFTICVIGIRKKLPQVALLPLRITAFVLMVVIFIAANNHMTDRLKPDYAPFYPGKVWMENDRHLLDSLQIPKNERILVLNEDPTNLALIYFDRRGLCMRKDWWNGNISSVTKMMKEKSLSIMVMKIKDATMLQNQDSLELSHFHHLATTDSTIVYRYQP